MNDCRYRRSRLRHWIAYVESFTGSREIYGGISRPNVLRLLVSENAPCSLFGSLLKVVLQQANFYARTARAIRSRSAAHPNHVDAVGRDLMVQYQVTFHRIRHLSRIGNRGLALRRRETLYFDDIKIGRAHV